MAYVITYIATITENLDDRAPSERQQYRGTGKDIPTAVDDAMSQMLQPASNYHFGEIRIDIECVWK